MEAAEEEMKLESDDEEFDEQMTVSALSRNIVLLQLQHQMILTRFLQTDQCIQLSSGNLAHAGLAT